MSLHIRELFDNLMGSNTQNGELTYVNNGDLSLTVDNDAKLPIQTVNHFTKIEPEDWYHSPENRVVWVSPNYLEDLEGPTHIHLPVETRTAVEDDGKSEIHANTRFEIIRYSTVSNSSDQIPLNLPYIEVWY